MITGYKKACRSCRFFTAKPYGVKETAQDKQHPHWCRKLKISTAQDLLRCGGDDYERNPDYHMEQKDEIYG